MPEKTLAVRAVMKSDGFVRDTKLAAASLRLVSKEMERANSRAARFQKTVRTFFQVSAVTGSIYALTRALRVLVDNAGQTEAALAGVSKTTEIVGQDLVRLGDRLLEASVSMGSARLEMLEVAKVAGQLGIHGSRDLTQFTIAITKLAEATNLTATEGATNLARFLFLTGNPTSEVDRVASSIVHLGNNVAATETEILRMATAISQTTASLGLSDSFIAGWGATTAAAGLRVESTSNAIFRFLEGIKRASAEGGLALRGLAEAIQAPLDVTRDLINTNLEGFVERLIGALAGVDADSVTDLLYALGIDDIRTHRSINTTIQQERSFGAFSRNIDLAQSQDRRAEALNTEYQRQRDTLLRDIEAINQRVAISFEKMSSVIVKRILPAYETFADAIERLVPVIEPLIDALVFFLSALGLGGTLALGTAARGVGRAVFGTKQARSTLRNATARNQGSDPLVLQSLSKREAADLNKSQLADYYKSEYDRLAQIAENSDFGRRTRLRALDSAREANDALKSIAMSAEDTSKRVSKAFGGARVRNLMQESPSNLRDMISRPRTVDNLAAHDSPIMRTTGSKIRVVGRGTMKAKPLLDGVEEQIIQETQDAVRESLGRAVAYGAGGALAGAGFTYLGRSSTEDIANRRDSNRPVGGFATREHFERFTSEAVRRTAIPGADESALAADIHSLQMTLKELEEEIRETREKGWFMRIITDDFPSWFISLGKTWERFFSLSPPSGTEVPFLNPAPEFVDDDGNNMVWADNNDPETAAIRRSMITEALRATPLDSARAYGQSFLPHPANRFNEEVKEARRLRTLEQDRNMFQRERLALILKELSYGQVISAEQRELVNNSRQVLALREERLKNERKIEELVGYGENTKQARELEGLRLVNAGLAAQIDHYMGINEVLEETIKDTYDAARGMEKFGERAQYAAEQLAAAAQGGQNITGYGLRLLQLGSLSPADDPFTLLGQNRLGEIKDIDGVNNLGTNLYNLSLKSIEMNTKSTVEEIKRLQADFDRIYGVLRQGIAHPLQRWFEGKSLGEALGESLMSIRSELISTWFVNPIVDSMDEVIRQVAGGALGLSENGFASAFDVNAAGADIKINMTSGQVTLNGLGLDGAGNLSPQGGGQKPFSLGGIIKDSFLSTITGGISDLFGGGSPAPINNQFSQIGSGSRAARGGIARRGGLTLVGEQGAEIVRLPEGAEVYPSGSMPADMMGSVQINNYYTINARDGNDIREVLEQERPRLLRDAKQAVVRDMGKRASKLSNATAAAAGA